MNRPLAHGPAFDPPASVRHRKLIEWVRDMAALTEARDVYWCDGSDAEYDRLCAQLVAAGTLHEAQSGAAAAQLPGAQQRQRRRPGRGPHLHLLRAPGRRRPDQQLDGAGGDARPAADRPGRRHAAAVSRRDARPHDVRRAVLDGPARLGDRAHRRRADRQRLCRRQHEDDDAHGPRRCSTCSAPTAISCPACTRSARRSAPGEKDVPWPCNATKYIVHYPETQEIWSYGSGYGGNALLGKKCFALRIASVMGRAAADKASGNPGWLAEHMLILGVTSPEGRKHHVAAAFPSACGKTNFAMLIPPPALGGWKVTTIGDDIAWIKPGRTAGCTRSIPRPATSASPRARTSKTNPNCMASLKRDAIFTNVAPHRRRRRLVGRHDRDAAGAPDRLAGPGLDARDRPPEPAPRRRIRTPASPSPRPTTRRSTTAWDSPGGVPIDAFIFGGRRSTTVPLVTEARDWTEGVYMAATMGSETTAAATGAQGVVRRDPFAMLPFIGYNMSEYFQHWLDLGATLQPAAPRCRRSSASTGSGRAPTASSSGPATARTCACSSGSSHRVEGTRRGRAQPPSALTPRYEDLDWSGLDFDRGPLRRSSPSLDAASWSGELALHDELFKQLAHRLPAELPRGAPADRGAARRLTTRAAPAWPASTRRRRRAPPPPASAQDLSDAEFAELDELLAGIPEPLEPLDVVMLDGFIARRAGAARADRRRALAAARVRRRRPPLGRSRAGAGAAARPRADRPPPRGDEPRRWPSSAASIR